MRQPQMEEMDERAASPGFEEGTLARMDIRDALDALGAEDQQLLYLVYHEGFTQKEAGVILGIPEGTVKSRLYRLRGILQQALGGEQDGT